jgi:uncharacterized protein YndB with AHSA1/START domain
MTPQSAPIVSEQDFPVSGEIVWKAITDKHLMQQWFFEQITDFEPRPGFETEFSVRCEGKEYLHQWNVTEVIPSQKISYGWKYGGCVGDSTVQWEIQETQDGTKLTLTHVCHEPFPQDDPLMSRESCQAGWNYFLHESLKSFLEKQT